jgi:hypothetical protein
LFYFCSEILSLNNLLLKQIRVQLETLLAEKSRLAQENSTYARENRFLREIVDFHQFSTTQDVVSLDDGDVGEDDPEEDSDLIYSENMLPVVEENSGDEELSPVPSRPESPTVSPGDPASPISSNSPNTSKTDASRMRIVAILFVGFQMVLVVLLCA